MGWLSRLTALFRKRRLDAELEDELRFHLEMEEQQNLRGGMDAAEARRQARLRLGGVEQVKEEYRERRGIPFVESLLQDLRFTFRSLRKSPGVTTTALLTLTLGIGIGTTIFSLVNAALLRPLPYDHPDRLVVLRKVNPEKGPTADDRYWMPFAELLGWQRGMDLFEGVGAFHDGWAPIITSLDPPERVVLQEFSPGFLSLLGVQPMLGRLFTPDEERRGDPVVILQYDIWMRRFDGDPNIVGKTIRTTFRRNPVMTVIGVMPRDFVFEDRTMDLWAPLNWEEVIRSQAKSPTMAMARLKRGVTLEQAQARADVLSRAFDQSKPEAERGWHLRLERVSDLGTAKFRPALLALLGAVSGIILIMCANLANLLLVKASGRTKELAVRRSMGASRARLVRLMLTESLFLSVVGCAGGLGLCAAALPILQSLLPGRYFAGSALVQFQSIGLDGAVVLFACAASLGAGLVFGLFPAILSSRQNLTDGLKDMGHAASGRHTHQLRNGLTAAQIAVSLVLAVGAVLLVRTVAKLYGQGPGFRPEGLLHLHVRWPEWEFEETLAPDASREERSRARGAASQSFYDAVHLRVSAVPGVRAVSSGNLTVKGGDTVAPVAFTVGTPKPDEVTWVDFDSVTPNHFRNAGIPLLAGRAFGAEEADLAGDRQVAIVNQTFAEHFFPNGNPVGKLFKKLRYRDFSRGDWMEIIGIVGDVSFTGMDQPPTPTFYYPRKPGAHLIVRTEGSPTAAIPAIVAAIREVNKAAVIRDVREVETYVDESIWERRLAMYLLAGLAGLALLLATVGVYGVLSHGIRERTHEIGIRMALGAGQRETLFAVIRGGLAVSGTGVALGLLLAMGLTRFLRSLLFGVEPLDPLSLALSALLMLAAALLGSYLPARRATKIDPMTALRCE